MKLSPVMKLPTNKDKNEYSQFLVVAEQHSDNPGCFISVYSLKKASNETQKYFVAQKVHNITELSEGRGNAIVNGNSVNINSNNNQTTSAINTSGNQAAAGGISSVNTSSGAIGIKEKIIVDFNFSSASGDQIVIAMTDETDSKVVVFDWRTGKVKACAEWKRVHIDRVSFSPSDEAREICVSGTNIWALYMIKDGNKDVGILNPTNKNYLDIINRARRNISPN